MAQWTKRVGIFTIVLALTSIISAGIFAWQLIVMQGQLKMMQEDQRPYVWVTNDFGSPQFVLTGSNGKGQVVWSWRFTNYGKSAAHQLSFNQFIKLGNRPYEINYGVKDSSFGGELPPGKINFGTAISAPEVTQEEYQNLLAKDNSMGILIGFEYFDVVGTKYTDVICAERLASGAITFLSPSKCKKQE